MNPILRKDMLGLLRLRRVAVIHLLYVGVLSLLVLATWPQQGIVTLASRDNDTLLIGLLLGQVILMVLTVPGVAATSIAGEREQDTFELLYASRLSARQLVVGKVLSAIALPMVLLVSGLPFLSLLTCRGDVDVAALAEAYLVLVLTAVMVGLLSLTVSALCRQTATALTASYAIVLLTVGGVLVPAAIMLRSQSGIAAQLLHYVRGISPVAATLSLLRPRLAELGGRPGFVAPDTGLLSSGLPPSWKIFIPFALAVIAGCGVILAVTLRRSSFAGDGRGGSSTGPAGRVSIGRRILFLIDPKAAGRPIGRRNPVRAKESRTSPLRTGRWLIRVFYVSLLGSLAISLMAIAGGSEHADLLGYLCRVLVAFHIAGIALIVPSLTSPTVSSEIENGTFEMLRLTPLGSGRIFWGKLIPALLPAMLPVVAVLPAYGAVCTVSGAYVRAALLLIPVATMCALLCCACGLLCSTLISSTARSTTASYLLVGAIVMLPMVVWWTAGVLLNPQLAMGIALPSPLVFSLQLLPSTEYREFAGRWPQHLAATGSLALTMFALARIRLASLGRHGLKP